ncbi:unnamed protein product [Knipowitschia caucasica]|uniref:Retrotransposon gag domain-containing protein n=1 Tax=Knipowitschia caucasica TaxID=637954 RepID=A0AAV2KPC0_KNICA
MWNGEESPFKPKYEAEERFPVRNVRVDLPPLFAGDGSQSFLGWVRQLEVAIQATVGTGSDCDEELVRILPTRLCKSAFLLWDSLPDRVKHDYSAVKEKLAGAFGQRQFMDRFRATLSARPRAAGESLEVYAADVSRLVAEAFPDYGVVARREEKFRRFLAGLDPALKSKCLEQGATDLEEALTIAERCENAREALQRDCVSNYPFNPHVAESRAVVQAVTSNDSLYKAVDQLSQEMHAMRMEMKSVYEENQRLRNSDMGQRQFVGRRSGFGGRCECTCGEPGCQGRWAMQRRQGRSPERGAVSPPGNLAARTPQRTGQSPEFRPPRSRSPSPGWRARREEGSWRRGVHFQQQSSPRDPEHQGNFQ